MPRQSPYKIRLTEDERKRLESVAHQYTSPYRDVIRSRMILYAEQGLGNDEIAARLDLPRQIVSKWRKRFYERGLEGLEDEPRGGCTARFSPLRRR